MNEYIDLHMHSSFSDGKYEPQDILSLAASKGVSILALTDHNTVSGVDVIKNSPNGMRVIRGIELTAYEGSERHILGYFNHDVSQGIEDFLNGKRELYSQILMDCFDKLNTQGYVLDYEDMEENGCYYAKKLCKSIFEKGYTESVEDAYILAFGFGKHEYRQLWQATVKECIQLIIALNGCPILAHPGYYNTEVSEFEIKKYMEYGLKGMECYHPQHKPEQTEYFLDICKQNNLLVTGGSDFHGDEQHPQHVGDPCIKVSECKDFLEYLNSIN